MIDNDAKIKTGEYFKVGYCKDQSCAGVTMGKVYYHSPTTINGLPFPVDAVEYYQCLKCKKSTISKDPKRLLELKNVKFIA